MGKDLIPQYGQSVVPNLNLISDMKRNHRYFVPMVTPIDKIIVDWSAPHSPAQASIQWQCPETKGDICSVSTHLSAFPVSENPKSWQELYGPKMKWFSFPDNWPRARDIHLKSLSSQFINNMKTTDCSGVYVNVWKTLEMQRSDHEFWWNHLNTILTLPDGKKALCLRPEEWGELLSDDKRHILPCRQIDGKWFQDRSTLFVRLLFGGESFVVPMDDVKAHMGLQTDFEGNSAGPFGLVFGLLPTDLILPFTSPTSTLYSRSNGSICKQGSSEQIYRLIELPPHLWRQDTEEPVKTPDSKRIKSKTRARSRTRRKQSRW